MSENQLDANTSSGHGRAYSEGTSTGSNVPYQANSGSGSRPIPMPRKPATSAHYISEERKRIKASIDAEANKPLTDEQQITDLTDEIFRLRAQVDLLKQEEESLSCHIALLKEQKMQFTTVAGNLQHEDIRKKEQELLEREQELLKTKRLMDSEFSDKEFEINQKKRDLQLKEDELHMKSKDLKQREFDIMNADSPADISSSRMKELNDRQFELDQRQEYLSNKEASLREWEIKLQQESSEYRRRLSDIQNREAYLSHQIHKMNYQQFPQSHHTGVFPSHEQQRTSSHTEQRLPNYTAPIEGTQQYPQQVGQTYNSRSETEDIKNRENSAQQESHDSHATTGAPRIPSSSQINPSTEGAGKLQETASCKSPKAINQDHELAAVLSQQLDLGGDQLTRDMELARQLMEEEEKAFLERTKKVISTDEMLALTLQHEQLTGMTDGLTHTNQLTSEQAGDGVEAATIIKKELDERLTEEQRRKKQEEEDFLMAQRLFTNDPPEAADISDPNES